MKSFFRSLTLSGFVLLLCTKVVDAQQWNWVRQETLISGGATCQPMFNAVDANGNVYITGTFSGQVTLGSTTLTAVGTNDVYLTKYNSAGTPVWSIQYGSNSNTELPYCITTDTSGNIYIGGGAGNTFTVNSVTVSTTIARGYVLKFNSAGVAQWVRMLGSSGIYPVGAGAIAYDKVNNRIYAAGTYYLSGVFGSFTLTGAGVQDSYVASLDVANGNVLWASNVAQSSGSDPVYSMTLDDASNIYIAGDFGSSTTIIGNQSFTLSNSGTYIAKFRPDGSYVNCYTSVYMRIEHVGFSEQTNQIYFAGTYWTDFNDGVLSLNQIGAGMGSDVIIARADTLLQPLGYTWSHSTGNDYVYSFCIRPDGVVVGLGAGGLLLTENHLYNTNAYGDGMVYMKFDNGLHLVWGRTVVGSYFGQQISSLCSYGNFLYMSIEFRGNLTCNLYSTTSTNTCGLTVRLMDEHTSYSGAIQGWIFNDADADGNIDSADNTFHSYRAIRNRTDSMIFFTDFSGRYHTTALPGPNELEMISTPLYYGQVFPSSPVYHQLNIAQYVFTDSINFGLQPIPGIRDMEIFLTGPGIVRSNQVIRYYIDYYNRGTDTMNGYVKLEYPSQLLMLTSTVPVDSVSTNTLFWNYSSMFPAGHQQFEVDFSVPFLPINTPINVYATVEPVQGDTTPNNNFDTTAVLLTGPLDPNIKVVTPAGGISPTDVSQRIWLDYVVHFQNIGTDTAFNVVIRDTISELLDMSTFEFISASSEVEISLNADREFVFRLPNIMLPDSATNPPGSQGFVRFRMKPSLSATLGDNIANKASIFFDYEFPVITNSTNTPVQIITAVDAPVNSNAVVFPNPSSGSVTIYSPQSVLSATLFTTTGQVASHSVFSGNNTVESITFPDLSTGLYFLKISTSESETIFKLIIR
ncbi:MAG: T9SS type A sorting domain-containing protein [Bacteroidia bacterium]|nr:T9SS type A sorting domain-containing protein [Bacteroidia bacterium]